MSLPYSFLIARRYHLGYSLLGRLMRRVAADRLQAEAYTYFGVTALLLLLILGQYLSWAFVGEAILAAPGGPTAVGFWIGQVASVLLVLLIGFIGWQPAITIEAQTDTLLVHRGNTLVQRVPLTSITKAQRISAATYYGHYRRYAQTRAYVNRIPETVLALHTADGPMMLGLTTEDQDLLLTYLQVQQGIRTPATPVEASA